MSTVVPGRQCRCSKHQEVEVALGWELEVGSGWKGSEEHSRLPGSLLQEARRRGRGDPPQPGSPAARPRPSV